MSFLRILIVAGCLVPLIGAQAADIAQIKKTPSSPPVLEKDVYFGSLSTGINLLVAPSQSVLGNRIPSASAPYLSFGAKIGALASNRLIGFQVDANLAGASSSWINPTAGSGNTGYISGGALHIYSGAITNTKVGAFFSADWYQINVPRMSHKWPAYHGGLEVQHLVAPALLVRARIGGGVLVPEGRLASAPNIRSYFGGVGITYAASYAIRLGADAHYSNLQIARAGASASLGWLDTGVFAEYRLQSVPVALRATASWLHAIGDISAGGVTIRANANAYRLGLSARYDFGSDARKGSLVDNELQTYNFLSGLR